MSHPVCADAVDGDDKVTWDEVDLRGFAARRDLPQTEFNTETEAVKGIAERLSRCSTGQ